MEVRSVWRVGFEVRLTHETGALCAVTLLQATLLFELSSGGDQLHDAARRNLLQQCVWQLAFRSETGYFERHCVLGLRENMVQHALRWDAHRCNTATGT